MIILQAMSGPDVRCSIYTFSVCPEPGAYVLIKQLGEHEIYTGLGLCEMHSSLLDFVRPIRLADSLVDCGIDPQKLLDLAILARSCNMQTINISATELSIIARALGAKDD